MIFCSVLSRPAVVYKPRAKLNHHHYPGDILNESFKNGWRGVFAPKPSFGARPVVALRQSRYAAAVRAIFGGSSSTGEEVF